MKKAAALCFVLLILVCAGAASARGSGILSVVMEQDGAAVPGGSLTLYRVEGLQFDEPYSPQAVEQMVQHVSKHAVEGNTRTVPRDGVVSFDGLEEGLYLIVQHQAAAGYLPVNPFAVYVSHGGTTEPARPKICREELSEAPQTGDTGRGELWLLLMGGSLAGGAACAVGIIRKHRRDP